MKAAQCDTPLMREHGGQLETKLKAAIDNEMKTNEAMGKVLEGKVKTAVVAHIDRWAKINEAREKAIFGIGKTLGCDLECVKKCTEKPHSYDYQDKNGTKQTHTYYQSPDNCAYECKCFEQKTVKIDWGNINY